MKERIDYLVELLNKANYEYHVLDKPTITDQEYDKYLRELINLEEGNPELVRNDSPTSSIQDFSWTSYQEFDTDEGIATVSKYGTITGRYVGSLTVKGVYKYNPNYVVYIRITVI